MKYTILSGWIAIEMVKQRNELALYGHGASYYAVPLQDNQRDRME